MPFLTSASNNRFVLKKNQLKVAWKRILCAANKNANKWYNRMQITANWLSYQKEKNLEMRLKTNYGQWMVSEMDKAQAYSDENYY